MGKTWWGGGLGMDNDSTDSNSQRDVEGWVGTLIRYLAVEVLVLILWSHPASAIQEEGVG